MCTYIAPRSTLYTHTLKWSKLRGILNESTLIKLSATIVFRRTDVSVLPVFIVTVFADSLWLIFQFSKDQISGVGDKGDGCGSIRECTSFEVSDKGGGVGK